MNQKFVFRYIAGLAVAASAALSGCASVAVTGDALQDRTATGLGLAPGSFTISNRKDAGVRTDYDVSTKDGRQFSCYVTGAASITGRDVSDAVCHATTKSAFGTAAATPTTQAAPTAAPAAACNALLKAAGRC